MTQPTQVPKDADGHAVEDADVPGEVKQRRVTERGSTWEKEKTRG